jgi:hypothetical protein
MPEVRILAPTGVIGSGFLESSFERGLSLKPHVIACDAGSTDSGPAFLGTGDPHFSREGTKRDLHLMLLGRERLGVPLIVGSCGTGGGDIGVNWMRDICLEIAREENLNFRLALIRSEQDKGYLKRRLREGRIKPLKPAPELTEEVIDRSAHIVGMMGPEPIDRALNDGADVILAGRASDTSLFAVVPLRMGASPGASWHAAKILECGVACATQRKRPDGVFAWIRDGHYIIEPLDPESRCSPQSVASHTLYENFDPFFITEPGGVIDTSEAEYKAESDRAVRVSGAKFQETEGYTVKLEGVECVGHQFVVIGGVRDPFIIRQLDPWVEGMKAKFENRVEEIFGGKVKEEDYTIIHRVYGRDAVMGPLEPLADELPHEVGMVFDITARDHDTAKALAQTFAHFIVHFPIPEWHGLISGLAYPYAPPQLDKGEVYRFNMNHVVEPDDPCEMFPMELMEV